jgi:hypothetical protein
MAEGRARAALAVTAIQAFAALDAKTYAPHALHGAERAWTESNCYIDVWIEILHALGLDPHACIPHVFPADFEGDQWTFFKPSHDDLFSLYGLEVHELNVWRPLIHNVTAQLAGGRIVLTEVDAFFLPDTAGTDYRTQHTKTTIAIQDIDVERRTLGYFHNSSYHALGDTDFVSIFRLDTPPDPAYMPFFAEFVKLDKRKRLETPALVRESLRTLRAQLARRPRTNPVGRFAARFGTDLTWMQTEGLPAYHAWAFASLRQLGAAFELAAFYVRWLGAAGETGLEPAAESFDRISGAAKALILKTARAVHSKKPLDGAAALADAERAWDIGMQLLVERYGA